MSGDQAERRVLSRTRCLQGLLPTSECARISQRSRKKGRGRVIPIAGKIILGFIRAWRVWIEFLTSMCSIVVCSFEKGDDVVGLWSHHLTSGLAFASWVAENFDLQPYEFLTQDGEGKARGLIILQRAPRCCESIVYWWGDGNLTCSILMDGIDKNLFILKHFLRGNQLRAHRFCAASMNAFPPVPFSHLEGLAQLLDDLGLKIPGDLAAKLLSAPEGGSLSDRLIDLLNQAVPEHSPGSEI
jgi:hypothetical protein